MTANHYSEHLCNNLSNNFSIGTRNLFIIPFKMVNKYLIYNQQYFVISTHHSLISNPHYHTIKITILFLDSNLSLNLQFLVFWFRLSKVTQHNPVWLFSFSLSFTKSTRHTVPPSLLKKDYFLILSSWFLHHTHSLSNSSTHTLKNQIFLPQ